MIKRPILKSDLSEKWKSYMLSRKKDPRTQDQHGPDPQKALLQSGHLVQKDGASAPFFQKHGKKPKRHGPTHKQLRHRVTQLKRDLEAKRIELEDAIRRLNELQAQVSRYEDRTSTEAEMFNCLRKSEKTQLFEILNKIVEDIAVYIGQGSYIGICRYRDEEDKLRALVYSDLTELNVSEDITVQLNSLFKKMRKKVHKMQESLAGKVIATGISTYLSEELKNYDTFSEEVEAAGLKPVVSLRVLMPNDPGQVLAAITIYEYTGNGETKQPTGHTLTKPQVERLEQYLDSNSIPLIIELAARKEIERREHGKLLKEQARVTDLLRQAVLAERAERLHALQPIRQSLPRNLSLQDGVNIYVYYDPAKTIGGDFYYFFKDQGRVRIWVGDGAGKGIPGALIASHFQFSLKLHSDMTEPSNAKSPAEILGNANKNAVKHSSLSLSEFSTCFFCDIHEDGLMTYAKAGHEPALLYTPRRNGLSGQLMKNLEILQVGLPSPISAILHALPLSNPTVVELTSSGMPLGIVEEAEFEERSIRLSQGQKVILNTDGITDARNKEGEQFGHDRLLSLIEKYGHLPADQLNERIIEEVIEFVGIPKEIQLRLKSIAEEFEELPSKEQMNEQRLNTLSIDELRMEYQNTFDENPSEKEKKILEAIQTRYFDELVRDKLSQHPGYKDLDYAETKKLRPQFEEEFNGLELEELRPLVGKLRGVSFEEMERNELEEIKSSYRYSLQKAFNTRLEQEYVTRFTERILDETVVQLEISTSRKNGYIPMADHLADLLSDNTQRSPNNSKTILYHEIRSIVMDSMPHAGQTDDITLLVIEKN